jgi:hypothetical protein
MKSNQEKTSEKKHTRHYQKLKSDYAKAELAIQQHAGDLMGRFPIIIALAPGIIGETKKNTICVDIFTGEGDISKIPKRLKVVFSKNKYGYVRTEIIRSSLTGKSHSTTVQSGTIIFNKRKPGSFGTLGCFMKGITGNKKYFITCNHVLTSDTFLNEFIKGEIVATKQKGIKTDIGKWHFGKMNDQIDLAVCEYLTDQNSTIKKETFIYEELDTEPAILISSSIKVYGKNHSTYSGFVVNPKIDFQIKYENKNIVLKNMILVSASKSANNYKTLTEGGDSGALVVTEDSNSIIGIVVGGDSKFTCVIPFNRIQNELNKLSINL